MINIEYLIVICSTAGQGGLPRNSTQKFWEIWCDEGVSSLDKHIEIREAPPIDNGILLEPEWIAQIDRNLSGVATKEHELDLAAIRYTKSPNISHVSRTVSTENERLTSKEHFQDVRKLAMKNVPNSPFLPLQNYEPGDMLEIIPFNDPHDQFAGIDGKYNSD
ncbi:unnamed protein product [Ambrosiozyma monospora]|uniref:Unnamed protein product n=1 Tax=Ambrosiozyma monospora TaxID=43982 RepID=A0ACB5TC81_AMBMO|nr:unnamed protein product [Ambrosiozyma monospora]